MATRPKQTRGSRIDQLMQVVRQPVIEGGYLSSEHMEVWQELVELRSVEFARLLRGFIRTKPRLRENAVEFLAATGLESALPVLRTLLRGRSVRDFTAAANGARLAFLDGRASARFRRAVFEEVAAVATGERDLGPSKDAFFAVGMAADALLDIGSTRALRLLKSGECLHPSNRGLLLILLSLQVARQRSDLPFGEPIPAGLLWPLFEAAKSGKVRTPRDRRGGLCGAILLHTAEVDVERTRVEAKLLRRQGGEAAKLAKEALDISAGRPDPLQLLVELLDSPGKFSVAASEVLRAYHLAQYVRSDGLRAYFDGCAAEFSTAVKGLRRVGKIGIATTVEGAAKKCARTTRVPTFRQLERAMLTMQHGAPGFRRYEDLLLRSAPGIETSVQRYIADHAEEFGAQRAERGRRT
jgi:hypothetical protein